MTKLKATFAAATVCICSLSYGAVSESLNDTTAVIINLNGFLCAKVLDIRPLRARSNVYEVTCVEYRGGSRTKTYIMDSVKGQALPS